MTVCPSQVLILLLALCNPSGLIEAARLKRPLDAAVHGLGEAEAQLMISQELLKWAELAGPTSQLYGILCLSWATFLQIADMLPRDAGKLWPRQSILPALMEASICFMRPVIFQPLQSANEFKKPS